jgi:hypothetical protein
MRTIRAVIVVEEVFVQRLSRLAPRKGSGGKAGECAQHRACGTANRTTGTRPDRSSRLGSRTNACPSSRRTRHGTDTRTDLTADTLAYHILRLTFGTLHRTSSKVSPVSYWGNRIIVKSKTVYRTIPIYQGVVKLQSHSAFVRSKAWHAGNT